MSTEVVWLHGLVGVVICGAALALTDSADISGLGLFDALPLWGYVGTALLVSGLFMNLALASRAALRAAWVHLIALLTVLHGLPGFVEPNPRFPVAWLHVGFAEAIATDGRLYPQIDARFSWPGFFTAAAYLQRVAGTDDLLWMVRFAPLVINLLAAVVVFVLAMTLGLDARPATLAACLFVVFNWIGQDYFAPQAVAFVMVFCVVVAVLRTFGRRPQSGRAINRLLGSVAPRAPSFTARQSTAVYIGCVVAVAAMVVSHQLSPPMLIAMLLGLSAVGRITTHRLAWIVALGFAGWLSYAAEPYWLGHLDTITGSVGDVSSVLGANVSERAERGGSAGREIAVRVRMLLMASIWFLAISVMLVRRFRGRLDPALLALFVMPFVPLVLQPYGGEMLLRVALFTLPSASIVIAGSIDVDALTKRRLIALVGLLSLAVPAFVIARYGNESYEMVLDDDLEIVDDLYAIADPGSVVYVKNRITLALTERVGEVGFRTLPSDIDGAIVEVRRARASGDPVYILFSGSQARWAEETQGREPGWLVELADVLASEPDIRIIRSHGDTRLLEVEQRT
ncbi:MAG: hypothetical protein WKF60_10165 [Ilumatobacter sp.]